MSLPPLANTLEGGTDGVAITTGNSGGASGNAFDAINGTLAKFSATQARGTLSMGIVDAAGTTGGQWNDFGDLISNVYFRAYIYLPVIPAAGNGPQFLRTLTGAGAGSASMNIKPASGFMHGYNAAVAEVATGTVAVPTNAWFRVEIRILPSTTVGQIEWKWWSDPESSGVPTDTVNATGLVLGADLDFARFGLQSTVPTAPFTIYLDNIAVSSVGWIGPAAPQTRFDNSLFPKAMLRPPVPVRY